MYQSHGGKANHGLTGTAGENNHAGTALFATAGVEYLCGILLVIAEVKRLSGNGCFAEFDGERVANSVTGQVFDRETGVGEDHLQVAAAFGVNNNMRIVDVFDDERFHVLQLANFEEH